MAFPQSPHPRPHSRSQPKSQTQAACASLPGSHHACKSAAFIEHRSYHGLRDILTARQRVPAGLSLIRSFAEQPMLIGYMRVSKADGSQTLDLQRDALLAAGVEPGHLYEDQASGKRDNRPGLEVC